MARLSHPSDADSAVRSDCQPGERGVLQTDPEPCLGGKLESATDKISDDIGVTHNDLVTVLCLRWLRSVEMFPECRLYPGSVSEVLMLISPTSDTRLRSDRRALSEDWVTGQHVDMGQMLGDELSSLHCPGHVRVKDVGVWQG